MFGRRLSVVLLGLVVASVACQPVAQEAGALSDADVAAIQAVVDALIEADLAGDWDAVAALFADDAVFMMPDRPALEGKAAWRAMVDEMQPTIHAVTVDVAEMEGRGDLAYIRGTYSETLSFGENEPFDLEGKFVWILEKQSDGSWLVSVGISNSNQPAAGTDS
jgi:uncharacterized protein (TIGR02246 family)